MPYKVMSHTRIQHGTIPHDGAHILTTGNPSVAMDTRARVKVVAKRVTCPIFGARDAAVPFVRGRDATKDCCRGYDVTSIELEMSGFLSSVNRTWK